MPTITGTIGNDTLLGTTAADDISAFGGNDLVSAGDANDTIYGGDGNDTLNGELGDDRAYAGAGNDSVDGGLGEDSLDGGVGNDTLLGMGGNDVIIGDDGSDSIIGDDNTAILTGGGDTIYGGLGNDTIDGGDKNDLIYGGDGNDVIEAGEEFFVGDPDVIYGGAGNDLITDVETSNTSTDVFSGDEGNDTITAGGGNDTLYGGTESDVLSGGNDADRIYGGNDADRVSGDAGNDLLYGDAGTDTLYGGTGNDDVYGGADRDTLYGDAGNDTLFGDEGDDVLRGGAGADSIFGGDDRDFIAATFNDVTGIESVDGGSGGADNDTLSVDITGFGWTRMDIDYDPLNHENGTITFLNATGGVVGTLTFTEIEHVVIVCFVAGTRITTSSGPVLVEDLCPGDLVLTRDSGLQPLRWVGKRRLGLSALIAQPELQPVRIGIGALGTGPDRSMLVSPQHRILIEGARSEIYFGECEVLVPAKHLVGLPEVTRALPTEGVTYVHILFDRHEIVLSDGIWTESFQPADLSLSALDSAARLEILALFPELARGDETFPSARLSLKAHEAKVLLARSGPRMSESAQGYAVSSFREPR